MRSNSPIFETLDDRTFNWIDDHDIPMRGVVLAYEANPPGEAWERWFVSARAAMRTVVDKDARRELRRQLQEKGEEGFTQLAADLTPEGSTGRLWWGIRRADHNRALEPRRPSADR